MVELSDMAELDEFLLRRVAEDERSATNARHFRKCEAIRQIVLDVSLQPGAQWQVCRYLANIYSDHPDFHEEWRV